MASDTETNLETYETVSGIDRSTVDTKLDSNQHQRRKVRESYRPLDSEGTELSQESMTPVSTLR